ncbi:MAG TPA: hypothetical protein VGF69_17600 [Thermoanaerobaculia bacterium]|jgi:hypothetical protein
MDIIERLTQAGRIAPVGSPSQAAVCSLVNVVEVIAAEGATAIVKLDGERGTNRYTVIISGGRLGVDFYRGDGDDLRKLLEEAVVFYDEKVWRPTNDSL